MSKHMTRKATRHVNQNEGLIFEKSSPGKAAWKLPPLDVPDVDAARLLGHKIVGGFSLNKFYPELGNASLWCCTELTTRSMIDTAAGLVAQSERLDATASDEASMEEVAK